MRWSTKRPVPNKRLVTENPWKGIPFFQIMFLKSASEWFMNEAINAAPWANTGLHPNKIYRRYTQTLIFTVKTIIFSFSQSHDQICLQASSFDSWIKPKVICVNVLQLHNKTLRNIKRGIKVSRLINSVLSVTVSLKYFNQYLWMETCGKHTQKVIIVKIEFNLFTSLKSKLKCSNSVKNTSFKALNYR